MSQHSALASPSCLVHPVLSTDSSPALEGVQVRAQLLHRIRGIRRYHQPMHFKALLLVHVVDEVQQRLIRLRDLAIRHHQDVSLYAWRGRFKAEFTREL